jgi:hypothetical protein
VAQLVEALRYKLEVAGSILDWVIVIFPWFNHSGRTMASNRNEYEEYFLGGNDGRCVGLTTLPTSRADCVNIWEPQQPRALRAFTF